MVISIKQNIQETVILTMSELTKLNDQNSWKKNEENLLQGIEYVVIHCPLTEFFTCLISSEVLGQKFLAQM